MKKISFVLALFIVVNVYCVNTPERNAENLDDPVAYVERDTLECDQRGGVDNQQQNTHSKCNPFKEVGATCAYVGLYCIYVVYKMCGAKVTIQQ